MGIRSHLQIFCSTNINLDNKKLVFLRDRFNRRHRAHDEARKAVVRSSSTLHGSSERMMDDVCSCQLPDVAASSRGSSHAQQCVSAASLPCPQAEHCHSELLAAGSAAAVPSEGFCAVLPFAMAINRRRTLVWTYVMCNVAHPLRT